MLISTALASSAGCAHLNWEPIPAQGSRAAGASMDGSGSAANGSDAGGALAWWSRAVEATPPQRESMLRNAHQAHSAWRIAMLRSLPGVSEEQDPQASQEALRAQLKRGLRDEEEALTRIRVTELDHAQACRAEASDLRTRLSRIIEIERDMGHGH